MGKKGKDAAAFKEKRLERLRSLAESTSEEVDSDKKIIEDEKSSDPTESVPTPVSKKPCSWLKLDRLDPQIEGKSSAHSSNESKEAKLSHEVHKVNDSRRKRKRKEKGRDSGVHVSKFVENQIGSQNEEKKKGTVNTKQDNTKMPEEESGNDLAGLIFMCNAKTKPDCFRYQLLGVSTNKKEIVMSIKPGLKLFLYDYDLKLLYGIYAASSAGGMKLEPAAFGGAFPAQVRFTVSKDCLPMPEVMFKKALKDSYDERTRKFRTALTLKQVKHLTSMFRPAPWLRPDRKHVVQDGGLAFSSREIVPHQDDLFLTENEYRINGLRQGRNFLPAPDGHDVDHNREPSELDSELKQLISHPPSTSIDSAVQQRGASKMDPFLPTESEYRLYGLKGLQSMPNHISTSMPSETVQDFNRGTIDPYDESTTSLVNHYLAMPMTTAAPVEQYPLEGRDPYINDLNLSMDTHTYRRRVPDRERAFASFTLSDHSPNNQRPYSLNVYGEQPSESNHRSSLLHETGSTSAPVSHRYSFAGPSRISMK